MGDPTRQERFRGAVLGAAVGDALGAPFEGWRDVSLDAFDTVANAADPLVWTDDTQMTIATAESLLAMQGFDGSDMAYRFVSQYRQQPWRGYAAGPVGVFAAIHAGAAWDEPARQLFNGAGSFGDGGAMRAVPAGLLRYRNIHGAADMARRCAAITHTHELGLQGSALQAAAVAHLVTSAGSPQRGNASLLLAAVRRVAPAPEFQRQLALVAELAADPSVAPRDIAKQVGNGVAATEAVPAALWAFLRHGRSYPETVRAAVLMGGDTDTIASMAGALAGAHLGCAAIPTEWLARVEGSSRLYAIADELLELAAKPLSVMAVD